ARRQTAEAAVAQRRVGLERGDGVEIDAEPAERLAHGLGETHVAERVLEQAADEEFEREIIDALAAAALGFADRLRPAVDDSIAQREDRGREPIVIAGAGDVLAHRIGKLGKNAGAQFFRTYAL